LRQCQEWHQYRLGCLHEDKVEEFQALGPDEQKDRSPTVFNSLRAGAVASIDATLGTLSPASLLSLGLSL